VAVDEMKEALNQAATPALKAMERAVALVRAHPYASAATLVALAGGWYVYETYVLGPAHRKQRQLEKRRARVNIDSALGLGFKSCPEVTPPSIIFIIKFIDEFIPHELFSSSIKNYSSILFYLFILDSILQTTEAIELAVEGEIPQWLAGKLFRSGPGTLEVDTELGFTYLITHWFDGLTVRRRPPQPPQTPHQATNPVSLCVLRPR
jgi:hypothetical protein